MKNRILVIDDQEMIHNDFKKILSARRINEAKGIVGDFLGEQTPDEINLKDFEIDCALQGEDGYHKVVEAVKKNDPYKVAFVDMRMPPGWDGLETITRIFKEDEDIQCVICTAYSDYTWDDLSKAIGATDRLLVLKKPFDAIEVIQLAYTLTQKWDLHQLNKDKINKMQVLVEDQNEQIENVEKQLIQSSKLASVGTLAAGVAHEINNPLTVIQGNMDILKLIIDKNDFHDEKFDYVFDKQSKAIARIINIVKGLKSFVRVDNEIFEAFCVHELIQDSVGLVESLYIKDGIKFDLALGDNCSKIFANKGRMQQVLMNLFSNAKDAMENSEGNTIFVKTINDGENVTIEITDEGEGISKANLDKIFDSFYTTKAVGKGTGLGLAITYKIIKTFSGTIEVRSKLGQGTSFIITLPCTDKVIVEEKEEGCTKNIEVSGKILVVDDEEDIREILHDYFESVGLEVETASNGMDALGKINNATFDFILTDIKMPKMNGHELITRAKEHQNCQNTKFIIISGSMTSEQDLVQRGFKHGADSFINKPFERAQIINEIIRLKK